MLDIDEGLLLGAGCVFLVWVLVPPPWLAEEDETAAMVLPLLPNAGTDCG
jgi:hypothetical protein